MRVLWTVTFYLFLTMRWLPLCGADHPGDRIKHVVAIMFENRSFDHILGFLKSLNPEIDGLTGNESNPINPQDPNSRRIKVSFDAPYDIAMNPGHSIKATNFEIWGSYKKVDPPTMDGFVAEIIPTVGEEKAAHIMQCESTPLLKSLILSLSLLSFPFLLLTLQVIIPPA